MGRDVDLVKKFKELGIVVEPHPALSSGFSVSAEGWLRYDESGNLSSNLMFGIYADIDATKLNPGLITEDVLKHVYDHLLKLAEANRLFQKDKDSQSTFRITPDSLS